MDQLKDLLYVDSFTPVSIHITYLFYLVHLISKSENLSIKKDDCITYDEETFVCDSSMDHVAVEDPLLKKIEVIEQKVDEILCLLRKDNSKTTNCDCRHVASTEIPRYKKIRKHSDLVEFEIKLKNDAFKANIQKVVDSKFKNMEKYSKSFRRFGYALIDTFCSRKLFKQYSWSGKRTRNGNKNYPLQDNVVFINFIFDLINSKMPTFSFADLEDIFSVLCRNKNSREKNDTDSSESPTTIPH